MVGHAAKAPPPSFPSTWSPPPANYQPSPEEAPAVKAPADHTDVDPDSVGEGACKEMAKEPSKEQRVTHTYRSRYAGRIHLDAIGRWHENRGLAPADHTDVLLAVLRGSSERSPFLHSSVAVRTEENESEKND